MRKSIASVFAVGLLVSMVSGCATIFNDDTQQVNVSGSTGKPIEGTINGVPFKGPGPVGVMRQKEELKIATATQGCAPNTVVNSKIDGAFWINAILGGVIGSTTDYASGEMWKYDDNVVISCSQ